MAVALYGANDCLADRLYSGLDQLGTQNRKSGIHRARRNKHLRNVDFVLLEFISDLAHRGDHAIC
ncbi:hypothetical protein SDC9_193984 [bioreactor metagenome]|uniref:Uncharacterized protein n=1 Tax=bioreactor metagenome TaxID=1076179 RepID=A0A645I568_9ZZZZ